MSDNWRLSSELLSELAASYRYPSTPEEAIDAYEKAIDAYARACRIEMEAWAAVQCAVVTEQRTALNGERLDARPGLLLVHRHATTSADVEMARTKMDVARREAERMVVQAIEQADTEDGGE